MSRRHSGGLQSLEAMEEEWEHRLLHREEDEEALLQELVDAMVLEDRKPGGGEDPYPPAGPGEEEFTCSSCHLVRHRTCLADERRMVCDDCAPKLETKAVPAAKHRTVEFVCFACGEPLLIPDREDSRCGFLCPGCGVHLRYRAGHFHYEWSHRQAPAMPREPR